MSMSREYPDYERQSGPCDLCRGTGVNRDAYEYYMRDAMLHNRYRGSEPPREAYECRKCRGRGAIEYAMARPPNYRMMDEPWPTPDIEPKKPKPKTPEQPKKETTGMNYSTAVMLINENIRAIKVIYEPETDEQIPQRVKDTGKKPVKGQTRYVLKTLDPNIKAGDYVVVPTTTRHGLTVVLVDEVDVEVDYDSTTEIKWVISRVDLSDSKLIAAEEIKWIEALKASEKRKKKQEIKKNLLDMYQDDGIEKLAIANMGNATALENKPE